MADVMADVVKPLCCGKHLRTLTQQMNRKLTNVTRTVTVCVSLWVDVCGWMEEEEEEVEDEVQDEGV